MRFGEIKEVIDLFYYIEFSVSRALVYRLFYQCIVVAFQRRNNNLRNLKQNRAFRLKVV